VDGGDPLQGLAHDFEGSRVHSVFLFARILCGPGGRVARRCKPWLGLVGGNVSASGDSEAERWCGGR
jgi:hypothetical protein